LVSPRWSELAPAACDTITDIARRRQEGSLEPGLGSSVGGIKPLLLVYLVCLVGLVSLVCFVDLVDLAHLVSFVQPKNQTNQINKMDQTDQITVRSLMIGPRHDPTRRKEGSTRLVELSDGFVRERHGGRQQVSPLDLQDSC